MVRQISRSIVKAPAAPVPMRAPVPATASMGSLVKDGFAWGLGNGIAHTVVGSIFRPAPVAAATAVATAVPQVSSEYTQCMKDFEDQAACRHLLPKGHGKE
jgi:hypothetical protein